MSVAEYYRLAVSRSFSAAINWARNQGILLTLLFATPALAFGVGFAALRALHKRHTWHDAMSAVKEAFMDFVFATVTVAAVAMLILFVIFFVQDAPQQVSNLQDKLTQSLTDNKAEAALIKKGDEVAIKEAEVDATTAHRENAVLQNRISDLSVPQFHIDIARLETANVPMGLLLHATVSISNEGAPAAAPANSWAMRITTPSGLSVEGQPATIGPEGTKLCLPGDQFEQIYERNDDLSIRASQPIDRNGYKEGVLGFVVIGLTRAQLGQDDTQITISVSDIYKRRYSGSVKVSELKAHSRAVFMSSLSHPFPEAGCPAGTVTALPP
jgi:hypothetical protein